ncbi:MAG: hypothetical protein AAB456_03410 [Patescibacteria group bacterium]
MADIDEGQYLPENSDPIDFQKDGDDILIRKINARIADAKGVYSKKVKEWKEADAYLDGDPSRVNPQKTKLLYNPIFPVVRNMTGLLTDSRPNPSVRLSNISDETPDEEKEKLRDMANNLAANLEEWWDDIRGQSRLQQWIMGAWTYADYFIFPYWDSRLKEVAVEAVKPTRVKIDPNADDIHTADYVIVDFYRSRQWMHNKYGKEKVANLHFSDYSEVRLDDQPDINPNHNQLLKNVAKLELYMEPEWWVYKVGNEIMEKIRNPLWALDEAGQRNDITQSIRSRYEKKGIGGAISRGADAIKGAIGLETDGDRAGIEIENALSAFTPKANYLLAPEIPLIQFDTYRLAGEQYSRSALRQTIDGVDDINDRKRDIKENSEYLGKPNIFIDGKIMNEDQAKRIERGRARGEVVRLNTGDSKALQSSVWVAQGVPVPGQFFDNIEINKREIDNVWGHHEVSRGGSDRANKTKGGILALQEADQTPIRFVSRNLEDSLQDLFRWVVQIRKLYGQGKYALESGQTVDYNIIDSRFKIFMKSGSMMPVSKEAQREEALELWRMQALDPLTLYERLNDPEPEKTAKRLEMWLRDRTVMTDDLDDQQMRVLEKIKLIQANQFDQVQITADDDPKTHADMLTMAIKSNQFSPEQEQFIAQLIAQYDQMAAQSAGPAAVPGRGI